MDLPVSVRYWTDRCVHSRPFAGLREAVDFLDRGGLRATGPSGG